MLDTAAAIARAAFWFMVAGCCLAVGTHAIIGAAGALWRAVHERPRGARRRPVVFDPCGIVDAEGRPCVLPDEHVDREHATPWDECDRPDMLERHRWDDTALGVGRLEHKYKPGMLGKFTATGEQPAH